ncbi:hypothetical protein AMJ85_02240 [candidate division BRC1 bacterium SM23_51]|nr:MAG: hypothetical protein AMJ85_02240 [candidate division BRC1 bacterium SM23_51]
MTLKLILIKFLANAVLLYGLALLVGGRIRFGGVVPVLSVAVFLVPINVFAPYLSVMVGIPNHPLYLFVSSAVCNGVMLYALSYVIDRFTVENFRVALGFAVIMGAVSLVLNHFLADQIAQWL